jgi:hypothetical protein
VYGNASTFFDAGLGSTPPPDQALMPINRAKRCVCRAFIGVNALH